ncbi:MAG: DMT family transporter [Rhodospirillales bacterium]|jgi:drug/metabolite transporter (DMT)-like permease|nr:DMT family transporter [Rhodospirillales bacterium]
MTETSRNLHLRGLMLSTAGMVILSPDALLLRLVGNADIWAVIFYRTLFMACTIALGLLVHYRRRFLTAFRQIGWLGLASAALLAASNFGFVGAITHTTVTNTLVILATTPLFSAVFGWLVMGEKVRLRTWLSILAAIAGIVVIFHDSLGMGNWLGDLMALGVAFVWGLNLVVVRMAGRRDMTPALCVSGFLSAAIAFPLSSDPGAINTHDLVVLAILGCLVLPLAFGLFIRGTHYVPAAEVALLAPIETVLGPIWVWIGVGEVPSVASLVGGAIVLSAILVNSILALKEAHQVEPAPS